MKVNKQSLSRLSKADREYLRSHPDEFEQLKAHLGDDPDAQDALWNLVYGSGRIAPNVKSYGSLDEIIIERVDGFGIKHLVPDALIEEDPTRVLEAEEERQENQREAKARLEILPERLIEIGRKRLAGIPLTDAERVYLLRERKKLCEGLNPSDPTSPDKS
jgi:hypothetical protein